MNAAAPVWRHGSVHCADAVHARQFDEELVILDLAQGMYFALDQIGSRLWSGLVAGRPVAQIAAEVVSEYDVTYAQALADLVALGDELVARGLMVRDDGRDPAHDR